MKKYRYTGIIMTALFLLFTGTLMIMKYAPAFSAERKIEGIERAAIRFEDLTTKIKATASQKAREAVMTAANMEMAAQVHDLALALYQTHTVLP